MGALFIFTAFHSQCCFSLYVCKHISISTCFCALALVAAGRLSCSCGAWGRLLTAAAALDCGQHRLSGCDSPRPGIELVSLHHRADSHHQNTREALRLFLYLVVEAVCINQENSTVGILCLKDHSNCSLVISYLFIASECLCGERKE